MEEDTADLAVSTRRSLTWEDVIRLTQRDVVGVQVLRMLHRLQGINTVHSHLFAHLSYCLCDVIVMEGE